MNLTMTKFRMSPPFAKTKIASMLRDWESCHAKCALALQSLFQIWPQLPVRKNFASTKKRERFSVRWMLAKLSIFQACRCAIVPGVLRGHDWLRQHSQKVMNIKLSACFRLNMLLYLISRPWVYIFAEAGLSSPPALACPFARTAVLKTEAKDSRIDEGTHGQEWTWQNVAYAYI